MELKDCPFCGSNRLRVVESSVSTSGNYPITEEDFVRCKNCLAEGPHRPTKELAEYGWNIRWQTE